MTNPGKDRRSLPAAPASRQVEVAGLRFRTLSSHRTDGLGTPTFVLIHGIGVSHRYLARLHRELAQTGEVHSIDLPGFGGMPKPGREVTVPDMAIALGLVLDRLGLADAILVGHSMGAQWVVELAVQRPDLASEVVVIGPVTDNLHRTVKAQSVALAIDSLREPMDANAMVFVDYLRCGPRWYLRQVRQMVSYPIEARVAVLARPLLIIRGGDDSIAGQGWTRRLRDHAPVGSLVVVPGHRHLVQHTAPRAVARAIRAYVDTERVSATRRIVETSRAT